MSDFTKTIAQKKAIDLLASDKKYVLLSGGSRAGKSLIIAYSLVVRALKCKSRHIVARLNFAHARASLWNETFPALFAMAFPELNVEVNKSEFHYQFENGSTIHIAGLDDKQRVEKILGRETSTVWLNEVSQIPYSSYSMVLTRLAEKNILKKRVWLDCNPPTKRSWPYAMFVKNVDPSSWEPIKNPEQYGYMKLVPGDNIENIDPDYIAMLENLPEKDRQRFLLGEFTDESGGLIYYAFNRERHVKKQTRQTNIPLVISVDFNVSPMTASISQIYDNKIHTIGEIYLNDSNTPELADQIKRIYPGAWKVIADSTGGNRTSTGPLSNLQILKNAGLIVPPFRNPFRVDRYAAVNDLFSKDRAEIDPSCVNLIRDFEQVSYKDGTDLPDTKEKHLTHCSDNWGYLAHWSFPIVKIETNIGMIPR